MNGKRSGRWSKLYETILRLVIQTAAAVLGLWIMLAAISSHSDRPWLYAAAIAMMGLPIAHSFESLVGFLGRIQEAMRVLRKQEEQSQHKQDEEDDAP